MDSTTSFMSIASTVDSCDPTENPCQPGSTGSNPTEDVIINDVRYIREQAVYRARGRSSWVSDHGQFLVKADHVGPTPSSVWLCAYCPLAKRKLLSASATSTLSRHLGALHSIFDPTKMPTGVTSGREQTGPLLQDTATAWRGELISLIAENGLPLQLVESERFRNLLTMATPQIVETVMPRSGTTLRHHIEKEYNKRKDDVKLQLANCPSKINITFDMWSGPDRRSILGIVAHHVSGNSIPQATLLGVKRVFSVHSGENQTKYLLQTVREYGIENRIGYFTMDNAKSNDHAVLHFLRQQSPGEVESRIRSQCIQRRLMCITHTLNLVVLALLKGAFSQNHTRPSNDHALGKLVAIVRYVRSSDQRKQAFRSLATSLAKSTGGRSGIEIDGVAEECANELVKEDDFELDQLEQTQGHLSSVGDSGPATSATIQPLELLASNETRWNSTYLMIRRALHLKAAITVFSGDEEGVVPYIGGQDWTVLQKTLDVLHPFYTATMMLEGRGATIHRVLPTLFRLKRHLGEAGRSGLDEIDESFADGIGQAVAKLDKYIDRVSKVRVYWAAAILHPKFKLSIATNRATARSEFTTFFETHWGQGDDSQQVSEIVPKAGDYDDWLNSDPVGEDTGGWDELNAYLDSERVPKVENVLEWWQVRLSQFPRLSTMARDILSIPASSAECERVFSRCKGTLTQARNRLADDTFDMLQCLQNWKGAPRCG